MHVCMYVCMYVCVHMYMHVCVCMCVFHPFRALTLVLHGPASVEVASFHQADLS